MRSSNLCFFQTTVSDFLKYTFTILGKHFRNILNFGFHYASDAIKNTDLIKDNYLTKLIILMIITC